ncbi:MAG: hypothetical protein ACEPOV_06015 [Hyphomicrobiales bacterium]
MNRIKNKRYIAYFCASLFSLIWSSSKGQTNSDDKRFNEQITIVGEYTPHIIDANKININPTIKEKEWLNTVDEFEPIAKKAPTSIELQTLQPMTIRFDRTAESWNNYLKAGIGTYLNPYVEFFHNGPQENDFSYGIHAKHHSSNLKIDGYDNSTFSDNLLEGQIQKNFTNHTLNVNAYYQRKGLSYYGAYVDSPFSFKVDEDSLKQAINYTGVALDFSNFSEDEEAFRYKIKGEYNFTFDKFAAKEHNINIGADLNKRFYIFDFSDGETIGLKLNAESYINSNLNLDSTSSNIKVEPYINLKYEMFNFYAGLNLNFVNGAENSFYFYPNLRAEMEIIPKSMVLYAGLKGELKRSSFKELTNVNPYISSLSPLAWTNNKMDFFGGVNGNLFETVDYNVQVSFNMFDNMPLYVQDTTYYLDAPFVPLYDNIKRFRVAGELSYHINKTADISANFKYNAYSTDNEEEAWQLPVTELGLNVNVYPIEKLTLNLSVDSKGKVPYKTIVNKDVVSKQIDNWTDISIGGAYNITDQISAFVQANNLLNNKYQLWQNYPVHGINFMVGGAYRF